MSENIIKFTVQNDLINDKVSKLGFISKSDFLNYYFKGLQYENKWKLVENGFEFKFNVKVFNETEYNNKKLFVSPNKMFVLQKEKDEYEFIPQR